MEHPRPLQGCTNFCMIFAHTGAGVIRDVIFSQQFVVKETYLYASKLYKQVIICELKIFVNSIPDKDIRSKKFGSALFFLLIPKDIYF